MEKVYGGYQQMSHNVLPQANSCCGIKEDLPPAETASVYVKEETYIELLREKVLSRLSGEDIRKAVALWIVCQAKFVSITQKDFLRKLLNKPKRSASDFSKYLNPVDYKTNLLVSDIYDYRNWNPESWTPEQCSKTTRKKYHKLQVMCQRAEDMIETQLKGYKIS